MMNRVTIYTESPAASRALEVAVRDGNGIEARVAAAGTYPSVIDLSERDLLLVSRRLPHGDVLQILGRTWAASKPPHVVFLDTYGVTDGDGPLELEPTCVERLLDRLDPAMDGGKASGSIALLFRPLERPSHLRPLSAEPIDEETLQAIVA